MNLWSRLNAAKGGRPAVLALILMIQISATMFFLADSLSELIDDGFAFHQWFEALVTLALMAGVALGGVELRRAIQHQDAQSNAIAKASGEMNRVVQQQFDRWHLTSAERDVAYLALKGFDVAEIAGMRNAAAGTVRAQLSNIYAKAGISGRAQLAAFFVEDLLADGVATPSDPPDT